MEKGITMTGFIGLLAPFVIYGYFHGLPFLSESIGKIVQSRNQWALILTVVVGVMAYSLTKNTYLAVGIIGLGLLLWWLNHD